MTSERSALFDSLVGFEYDFYGVDDLTFCIGLDGKRCAFEAIEDPSDGFRSYLECVEVSLKESLSRIFFGAPLGRVLIERTLGYDLRGYSLTDVDTGHVWLRFGTDETDDYYPIFTFVYRPRAPEATTLPTGRCSCCSEKDYDDDY